jgi:MFS family permease
VRGKGFRTVLRNPYFLRLWMAQLISQTIMNAANYGIIVLIATNSRSVAATGGAIISFSLPAAIFGAPAGVLVDRFDKRRVLWMSNVLRALATLGFVVALFVSLKQDELILVYLLTFFISLVGQFFAPAEGAAIPLLVHEDELVNALALFNITFTLSQALGLIMLGPLVLAALPPQQLGTFFHYQVTILPTQSLFVIVSLLYLVCAGLVATIPRARLISRVSYVGLGGTHRLAHEGERIRGIWFGILECWRFVRRDNGLLAAIFQLSLGGVIIAVVAMIAPEFAQDFLHRPASLAALVFIPAGVGLVLGSAVIPHLVKLSRRPSRHSVLIGVGVSLLAAASLMLTFVHWAAVLARPHTWYNSLVYWVVILTLTFVIGLGLDLLNIPAQTVLQERSPDWIKGRVLALQMMLFNAATVPVVYLMGLAADIWTLPVAMNILAVGVVVAGFGTIIYGARQRRQVAVGRPAAQRPAELHPPMGQAGRLVHRDGVGPMRIAQVEREPGTRALRFEPADGQPHPPSHAHRPHQPHQPHLDGRSLEPWPGDPVDL